jgi:hypothetical protein
MPIRLDIGILVKRCSQDKFENLKILTHYCDPEGREIEVVHARSFANSKRLCIPTLSERQNISKVAHMFKDFAQYGKALRHSTPLGRTCTIFKNIMPGISGDLLVAQA